MEIEGKRVDGFVLHPGDKLIIQADPHQSRESIERFQAQLNDILTPLGVEYLVIATQQLIIVRDRVR